MKVGQNGLDVLQLVVLELVGGNENARIRKTAMLQSPKRKTAKTFQNAHVSHYNSIGINLFTDTHASVFLQLVNGVIGHPGLHVKRVPK